MGTFGTPSSYNNTGALGSATNPTTAQGLSRDRENQKAILELPGTQAWVEKTITDGVIVPTSAEVIVLPEGGASTDSLTTIALTSDGTTTLHEGMLIRLKAANSNTITVVHGTGANNISTIDGNNVVLDTTWYLELKLINGLWVQQETNAYKTANEAKITAATLRTEVPGLAAHAAMPSGRIMNITWSFPNTTGYTAPFDGYLSFSCFGAGFVYANVYDIGGLILSVGGILNNEGLDFVLYVPVSSGNTVDFAASGITTIKRFCFVKAHGVA